MHAVETDVCTHRFHKRHGAAFSLIELLVVIAIILLLVSLLLPTLSKTKSYALRVVCANNMRNLFTGWIHYSTDHGGAMMSSYTGRTSNHWVWAWNNIEDGALYPYVEDTRIFQCPTPANEYRVSYAINGCLNGEYCRTSTPRQWRGGIKMYNQIRDPVRTLVFIEEDDYRGYNVNSWLLMPPDNWKDFVSGNHDGGDNIIFADGHLEYWYWEDPDTLTLPFNDAPFGVADPGNVDIEKLNKVYWPDPKLIQKR